MNLPDHPTAGAVYPSRRSPRSRTRSTTRTSRSGCGPGPADVQRRRERRLRAHARRPAGAGRAVPHGPGVFEQEGLAAPAHGFTLSALRAQAASRGMVAVTTPDPTAKPFIVHGYYTDQEDMRSEVAGLRMVMDFAAGAARPLRGDAERRPGPRPTRSSSGTCARTARRSTTRSGPAGWAPTRLGGRHGAARAGRGGPARRRRVGDAERDARQHERARDRDRGARGGPDPRARCRWAPRRSCHRSRPDLVKRGDGNPDERGPEMKVLVAGATGAMGKQLLPRLCRPAGPLRGRHHAQRGEAPARSRPGRDRRRRRRARSGRRGAGGRSGGARGDRASADRAPGERDMRSFDRSSRVTNRLRTGAPTTCWRPARRRHPPIRRPELRRLAERATVARSRPKTIRSIRTRPPAAAETLAAIRHLESAVTGADWLEGSCCVTGLLRAWHRHRPRGSVEMVAKRRLPIVGGGTGVWSFIQSRTPRRDGRGGRRRPAAASTTSWTTSRRRSPNGCRRRGKRRRRETARRRPRWLGRLARRRGRAWDDDREPGASNAKAKRELGWEPRYASWREGFASAAGDATTQGQLPGTRPGRSPSPTGCSAASVTPRTSSRTRFCASTGAGRQARSNRRGRTWRRGHPAAIDELRSARVRRETYVGRVAPRAAADRRGGDPARTPRWPTRCRWPSGGARDALARRAGGLPAARRVRLRLRRGRERSSARARRTAASSPRGRARHVEDRRPRFEASPRERDELASGSSPPREDGDVDGLRRPARRDVVLHGDGGGKAAALGPPGAGRARVARSSPG